MTERRSSDSDPQRAEKRPDQAYQALFNLEGVDLEFRDEALVLSLRKRWRVKPVPVACVPSRSRTARYHVRSAVHGRCRKRVIDESVIDGQSKPLLIYGKRKRNRHLVNN